MMLEKLGIELLYPDLEAGLRASEKWRSKASQSWTPD
jgi:hypothetical protein